MRLALLLAVLAPSLTACLDTRSSDDSYYYDDSGWGSGWGGGGGTTTEWGCQSDAACGGGFVCARTRECLPASQVRVVHALWTVNDAVASDTSCASSPKLSITFSAGSATEQWGFTPVPCSAGKFTIDKFPTRFTFVQLAREHDYSGGAYGTFDVDGNALLDLPY